MSLWIGVHLPLLPLEIFRPRWSEPGPYVVLDRERVLVMSRQAQEQGVRAGMRRGGVLALYPEAVLYQRHPQQERDSLDSIALCLLQYTPEVAFAEQDTLLLNITASLSLFGGCRSLWRSMCDSLQGLGFSARISMAPTAQGAWLLARHVSGALHRRRRAIKIDTLIHRLDRLPCLLLPLLGPYEDWLEGIGCRTFSDVRRLPRAGIKRRCSPQVLDVLDRAYGQAPELFDWVQPPQSFFARFELMDRIEHVDAMIFVARRLILQLIGWLTARQLAVSQLVFGMEHERGRYAPPPTLLEVSLAEATFHEVHLTRLTKELLSRHTLSAPVIAVHLKVNRTEAMAPVSESLFPEPGGSPADHRQLLELLTARLGKDCVLTPALKADYRPEIGNRWLPVIDTSRPRALAPPAPVAERPFWLLDEPVELPVRGHRPFYGAPLHVLGVAERIECGWWDGHLVVRDYFVAEDADAACYWIYRQRTQDQIRWYLHGLFA